MLGHTELTPPVMDDTIGVVLKYEEDVARIREGGVEHVLESA